MVRNRKMLKMPKNVLITPFVRVMKTKNTDEILFGKTYFN